MHGLQRSSHDDRNQIVSQGRSLTADHIDPGTAASRLRQDTGVTVMTQVAQAPAYGGLRQSSFDRPRTSSQDEEEVVSVK